MNDERGECMSEECGVNMSDELCSVISRRAFPRTCTAGMIETKMGKSELRDEVRVISSRGVVISGLCVVFLQFRRQNDRLWRSGDQ